VVTRPIGIEGISLDVGVPLLPTVQRNDVGVARAQNGRVIGIWHEVILDELTETSGIDASVGTGARLTNDTHVVPNHFGNVCG